MTSVLNNRGVLLVDTLSSQLGLGLTYTGDGLFEDYYFGKVIVRYVFAKGLV